MKEGLVCAHHNDASDLNIDLCNKAGLKTASEPVINNTKDSVEEDGGVLQVDWVQEGFGNLKRKSTL